MEVWSLLGLWLESVVVHLSMWALTICIFIICYTARNMVETCDVLFTNFPGLLEKPDYKDQVIEIMQEPKQYILKLEGETDNEQH